MFSLSAIYRTKHLRLNSQADESITDRQEKVPGYIQQALALAKIFLVGAGGLGGEIGEALVRKGIGQIVIFDDDVVTPSNLSRQHFYKCDLYKNKAKRLAKNLAKEGFCDTVIKGYGLSFQDALGRGIDLIGSVAIVAVDSNPGRVAASKFYSTNAVPVIFTAVSREADHGYVFIQEPGKACFGCLFPNAINDKNYPCPGTAAVKDILKVVAGIVVYGVDTLLMQRKRFWNYKHIYLDGSIPGSDWKITRRQDCQLCQPEQTTLC